MIFVSGACKVIFNLAKDLVGAVLHAAQSVILKPGRAVHQRVTQHEDVVPG